MTGTSLARLASLDPGLVETGWADQFIEPITSIEDPEALWRDATFCAGLIDQWQGHVTAQDEARYLQAYLEVQLGHVFGPKPGPQPGPGRGRKNGLNSGGFIPSQIKAELRAFFGHRDRMLAELLADHALPAKLRELDSRRARVLKARSWERKAQRRKAREEARTGVLPDGLLMLDVADARALPVADETVDLIVTSPPYAVEIAYTGGDVAAGDWFDFMADWLREAYRVTKTAGRLALNVPLDSSTPGARPTYAEAIVAALRAGWEYAATVDWNEGNTTKGGRALGTPASSRRPHHVSQVEMIAILSKGPMNPSSDNPDDITDEEFLIAGRGPWTFSGETRPWEDHPAAFPLELPRRLIPYLCRVGDVVMDPFVGSGTTLVAALERGRRAIGFDVSPAYVESARLRLSGVP